MSTTKQRPRRAARPKWLGTNPHLVAGEPAPGMCAVCGCTDEWGCDEGCCWVNSAHTLCSVCAVKLGVTATDTTRKIP